MSKEESVIQIRNAMNSALCTPVGTRVTMHLQRARDIAMQIEWMAEDPLNLPTMPEGWTLNNLEVKHNKDGIESGYRCRLWNHSLARFIIGNGLTPRGAALDAVKKTGEYIE